MITTAEKWCNKSTSAFIIINVNRNHFWIHPLHSPGKRQKGSDVDFSQHRILTRTRVVFRYIGTVIKSITSGGVENLFAGVTSEASEETYLCASWYEFCTHLIN